MHGGVRSQPQLRRPCEVSSSLPANTQPCLRIPTAGFRVPRRSSARAQTHVKATAAAQQAEERASSHAQASTSAATASEPILTRKQSQESVADKLIDLFATKTPDEWRKLIAFSKQWSSLADRCGGLAPSCWYRIPPALCAFSSSIAYDIHSWHNLRLRLPGG